MKKISSIKRMLLVNTHPKKLLQQTMFSFLMMALCMVQSPAQASNPLKEIKVSLSVTSQPLKKVLKTLENQTGLTFFYLNKQVDTQRKVNVQITNGSMEEVLQAIFNPYDISYQLSGKQIILKKESTTSANWSENATTSVGQPEAMMALATTDQKLAASPAVETITGKVTGDDGAGLPGVSVVVKGTTTGTATDVNGAYSVTVPDGNATLVFSFIGYVTQEVAVNNQTTINVTLAADIKALSEVVVVGYGTQSRKNLTSAITNVKPEELNRGAIVDVGQLLQGKVPGLNISASGDPNRAAAVVLRGASTLNSSQGPFYVIDGIPGADISILAPDDIASIDVLKDAAATAIYGNRAANGVIMVTTKRGKKGQMQVSYNGYVGIEKVSNQLDMMNASQLREFVTKNGQAFSPANDKGANTNWQDAVQRTTAFSQNHNLSLSGGTEHSTYSASLNYAEKEGILLGSNLSRVIARLSLDQYTLNDKVKFGLLVTNSNSNANNTPLRNNVLQQMINHLPVSPIKNEDGTYFENFASLGYFNPAAMLNYAKDDTKSNNLTGAFTTHVDLPLGFSYDLNFSYQNSTSLHGEAYASYYTQYNSSQFYSNPDPQLVSNRAVLTFGTNGSALRNAYQDTRKVVESFLTWDKQVGDHSINAVVGYSWQENILGDGFQTSSTNFPVNSIGYSNFALSNPYAISAYRINFGTSDIYQETRLISDFGRLNYNYKEKYLLQGSIRRDGSSVFGANNRWGYFPAVGVAWRINEESFMRSQNIFNDLKLRASYGVTGNASGFNAYTSQIVSGSLGTYYFNGVQVAAYGPTQAANPNLKWEKTATTNIGLDFAILKGKVSGTVEWYDKNTTGMIYSYAANPAQVSNGSIVANGGSLNNTGIEVTLNATLAQSTKGFSWNTSLNLASNTNKITSLTNPLFAGGDSVRTSQPDGGGQTGSTLQILKAGKPLGQFFTLEYAGKNEQGISQYVSANGSLTTTPTIGKDYKYMGSPQPKLLLGWTNTFSYGNFDLNVFIRGVFGNKIFNATRADLFRPSTAQLTNILTEVANELPSDVNAYKYSSRFIEDGSYVRLDNATFGYNFKKISPYIQRLRLYTSVNNAFVITGYKGIDPEVNQGGIAPGVDANNFYPKTRTFLFGVNVSF